MNFYFEVGPILFPIDEGWRGNMPLLDGDLKALRALGIFLFKVGSTPVLFLSKLGSLIWPADILAAFKGESTKRAAELLLNSGDMVMYSLGIFPVISSYWDW